MPVVIPETGRPVGSTKLTPELVLLICEKVAKGTKPVRAVQAAGFSAQVWYQWQKKAEQGLKPYAGYVESIHRAEALCLAALENKVVAAADTDWRAGMAVLERRDRQTYGPKVDVTARRGDMDPDALSDADLLQLAAAAQARGITADDA
jgi:hypothetical protein